MNNMNNNRVRREEIDQALEGSESRKIAKAIKKLPEDELSLSWRSQLNEKIAQEATRKAKTRRSWRLAWGTGMGLGLSATTAVVFMLVLAKPDVSMIPTRTERSFESEIVAVHQQVVQSGTIAGEGLSALDETPSTAKKAQYEWKQEDLEAL